MEINDIDELRQFLESINESQQTPETRKEELAHKERLQDKEHAHVERLRNMEHAERLRALALGHPLSDSGEVAKAQSAIRAIGTMAILVPLALAAAVGIVSVCIIQGTAPSEVSFFGITVDLWILLFAIVWGVGGLVMLVTIMASLRAVRRVRDGSSPAKQVIPPRGPVSEDRPPRSMEQLPSS